MIDKHGMVHHKSLESELKILLQAGFRVKTLLASTRKASNLTCLLKTSRRTSVTSFKSFGSLTDLVDVLHSPQE